MEPELAAAEAEMAVARDDAAAHLRASLERLEMADLALAQQRKSVWGGPAAEWLDARDAAVDAIDACAAWEKFCN